MQFRKVRLGLGAGVALALALVMSAPSAFADYAPTGSDVVGVGSDTVQYAIDFVADGFPSGATGYNALGNLNRLVNFDATADANARLAYSPDGIAAGSCGPGMGGTAGTGNQTTTHADKPCYLNPTIVLRAGLSPVLRPNGSGAGYDALQREIAQGLHRIDFSRSSTCQGAGAGCRGKTVSNVTSVQIATDPFAMLVANTTNAVPLSAPQIKAIYEASTPSCKKWTDVGGTSTNDIVPIIPQVGSGTRNSFLTSVGIGTPGNCAQAYEENDPTAIFETASPADTIEPMSGGRLNMFKGLNGSGAGNGYGGFFLDPSCGYALTTPAACVGASAVISPAVHMITTGTPSDAQPLWNVSRPLYVYFRSSDIAETAPYGQTTPFQPGSTLNWVRALFYNPCSAGMSGCVTISGTQYGPGGQPYIRKSAGQSLISLAGLAPTYVVTTGGP